MTRPTAVALHLFFTTLSVRILAKAGPLNPGPREGIAGTDKRSKGMRKAVLSASVCALMAVAAGCGSSGSSGPGTAIRLVDIGPGTSFS